MVGEYPNEINEIDDNDEINDRIAEVASFVLTIPEAKENQTDSELMNSWLIDIASGKMGNGLPVIDVSNINSPRLTKVLPVSYDTQDRSSALRTENLESMIWCIAGGVCNRMISVEDKNVGTAFVEDNDLGMTLRSKNGVEQFQSKSALLTYYTAVEISSNHYDESDLNRIFNQMCNDDLYTAGWSERQIASIFPDEYWQRIKNGVQMSDFIRSSAYFGRDGEVKNYI